MSLVVENTSVNEKTQRVTFRRAFPLDVRTITGWEHKVALGLKGSPGLLNRWEKATSDFEAKLHHARRILAGQYDQLDSPTIAFLAETFRVEMLADDEAARWSDEERELYETNAALLHDQGAGDTGTWGGNEGRRWAHKARENIEWTLPVHRELRANGDMKGIVAHWQSEAEELLEAKGLIIAPDAKAQFAMLCRALNDAAIAAAEAKLKRLDGEHVETPRGPEAPIAPRGHKPPPTCFPLLDTYESYAKARGLSPGVRDEWRRYIQQFIVFVGHDDILEITAEKVREWRDWLLDTPTRHGKPRSATTVRDKYLMSLKTTLNWAVDEGRLTENVARQVILKKPKRTKLRDPSFTDKEALAILTATMLPVTGRLAPYHVRARRWIPWLCAYSGARVNEFSQMRREDLQKIEGIWIVRITPEAGSVKNLEARLVPLHPHLIEQGFVKMVQAQPEGPIFYDPSKTRVASDSNRHFKKVGEKIAKWVREEVGITDPSLQPNHAWRHRFKSLSYLYGIEERMADAIQAHAAKTTGRTYGEVPLSAKAAAIAKLPRYQVED